MKVLQILLLLLFSSNLYAQDEARQLVQSLNKKFLALQDYQAAVDMKFNIPGVKMHDLKGRVYFRKPNKFRIRAKGIFFMPKQNPIQNISTLFLDTTAYTTLISGYEVIEGRNCAIVNMIPLRNDNELILGKFWIDRSTPLIMMSEVTTRNNGTIETRNFYGSMKAWALPDRMLITVEVNKIKVPKMMAVDLNKKSADKKATGPQREKGSIDISFSNYKINSRFPDEVFTQKDE